MFRLATKFLPESAAFERACAAGFRGAEFWLGLEVLSAWRNILATARANPLYYALHFPNRVELDAEALQSIVLLYRELECTALIIHQSDFERYGEAILALEPSLRIGVENHVLDPAEFERWAERHPGLTLDVEHLWKYTLQSGPLADLLASLDQFLTRFGDRLQHVHLPGYRIGGEEHCPMNHSPEMVTRVFGLLADHGFERLVVSEANPEYQNAADLRRDVSLFRAWWTQHFAAPKTPQHEPEKQEAKNNKPVHPARHPAKQPDARAAGRGQTQAAQHAVDQRTVPRPPPLDVDPFRFDPIRIPDRDVLPS